MKRTRPSETTRARHFKPMALVTGMALVLVVCLHLACSKKADTPPPSAAAPAGPGTRASVPPPASDQSIVTVHGKSLTRSQLEAQVESTLSNPQYAQAPPQALAQLRNRIAQQTIQQFVNQTLIEHAMEGITVELSEEEISEAIEEISASLPPGVTLEQALSRNGVSPEKLRADLTPNLRIRKFIIGQVGPIEDATQAEIEAYYTENTEEFQTDESVTASHILLQFKPDADDTVKAEKRALAETYIKELRQGADFAAYARDYSEGPSGPNGGSLGTFGRGQMVGPFERAAFSQPVGEIGDIVETSFGIHIIQVQERSEGDKKTLADVSELIGEQLKARRLQSGVENYIVELRKSADIQFATAAAPRGSGTKTPATPPPAPQGSETKASATPPPTPQGSETKTSATPPPATQGSETKAPATPPAQPDSGTKASATPPPAPQGSDSK